MELEYAVDTNDLIAAAVACNENSAAATKIRRMERYSTALSVFLFFVILFLTTKDVLYLFPGIALALLMIIFWPSLQRRSFRNREREMLSESSHLGLIGKRVLHLEAGFITERSELIWQKIKPEAIEKIINTSTHLILILAPNHFLVIPHSKVTKGDLGEFITALRAVYSPA